MKLRLECGPDPVAARPSAVAARAVHRTRYHHWRQPKLFIERDIDSGSRGCPLQETSANSKELSVGEEEKVNFLKVPKCEILMSWILMIFLS
jgi:hypothetical protein